MFLVEEPEAAELSETTDWSYFGDLGVQYKLGGAKNVTCILCHAT